MSSSVSRIVIVGGGSAGWLAAGVIAATYASDKTDNGISVTLVESPDINTIGVGEGTWPSMRRTLERIGLSETDFLTFCDASFKQGTEFFNWRAADTSSYTHPFSPPLAYDHCNPAPAFLTLSDDLRFDQTVCPQTHLFKKHQAPKQITSAEYAGASNYGYHLDASKFAEILKKHCISQLGVKHVVANVRDIVSQDNGDIAALKTDRTDPIDGDLFVDCSGARGLLIHEHYNIGFKALDHLLFNNRAVATQVPYATPESAIASCTQATTQENGWIWDIGLTTRRGVGYVFSSHHQSDELAIETLHRYVQNARDETAVGQLPSRVISFQPGHRSAFWHKNCVALGMAAGFIEPLEASALVLVELGAAMIADELPPHRAAMTRVSQRYNERFNYRWDRIVDFLKLHYILSDRAESYWQDHRDRASIPESLIEQMQAWSYRTPWHDDHYHADEMFPSASYQYVLYGMKFKPTQPTPAYRDFQDRLNQSFRIFQNVAKDGQKLEQAMPTNRSLLTKIGQYGLKTI